MFATHPDVVTVIDFRRHSMMLEWNARGGTWTACDVPPPLVHGVALIRSVPPNICLYGRNGRLHLQIGVDQFDLADNPPRIRCTDVLMSFGLRQRFTIESASGGILFKQGFWTSQNEFFHWLTSRVADSHWRQENGRRWSNGLEPAALRAC